MVIEILEMRGDPGAVEGEGDPSRLAGADGETGRQGCGGSPVVKVAVDDILQLGVPPEPNLDIPVKGPVLLGGVPLLLEELEHAKARGARILAEVVGYGATCDAYHITAPHPDARGGAKAMTDAMAEAGYTAEDTVYVNAHGTGTPMNDAIETIAIKKALGEEKAREAFVSSTKSMTGHMLGAAGAIEALACIFALQESIIPPTINLNEQDEACDLNCVPNTAVKTPVTLALSNSLGFGGHNACLAFRKVR